MSRFKTQADVVLLNGGYLSDKGTKKPVNNTDFVKAQQSAHRLALIAQAIQGKNFTPCEVADINAIIAEVDAGLKTTQATEFVKVKAPKEGKLTAQLAAEALAWDADQEKASTNEAINARLQEFTVVNEFETHGLFFKSGIVKLEKIYTMKEIIATVKAVHAVMPA